MLWSARRSPSPPGGRRPPVTTCAASSIGSPPSWCWSTLPACIAPGPCSAGASTISCARHSWNPYSEPTWVDVDAIVFCIPANEKVGPGDRFIARDIAASHAPIVVAVTKADTVSKETLAAQLLAVDALGRWADIVPVSARDGYQVDVLVDVLASHLPLSPPLYPTGDVTDEPRAVMIGELVREAALEEVRDELPHSLAVVVDEILDPATDTTGSRVKGAGGRLQVRVSLVVERDSQKAIMIGRGGSRLKEIGIVARRGIEELVGRKVYLDLHVRTAKDWQSDPKALARLGF